MRVSYGKEGIGLLGNKPVLQRQLDALQDLGPEALGRAMRAEADEIMEISSHMVPVEFGNLLNSAQTGDPERLGDRVTVKMGYGGGTVNYALAVHEIPPPEGSNFGTVQPGERRHLHTTGRRARHGADIGKPGSQTWKYLERPFLAKAQGMEFRLAKRLRAEIEREV